MKKKLLLILSAALVMMTTGLTVVADTVVFDAVDIVDVTPQGILVGYPDGAQVMVDYDLLTAVYLPQDIPQGHPPEPCRPLVKRWNRVIQRNRPAWWKAMRFRHLLRRMAKKGCPVLIEYEDVQPPPPIRTATAIQPDAL